MTDVTEPPKAEAVAEEETANRAPLLVVAWLWVGLPFAYGVYELIRKVAQLFN
jgi:hypothetical protein